MVGRKGFEPLKAEPSGLQPDPFDRFGTYPHVSLYSCLYIEQKKQSGATCRDRTGDNPLTRRALYQLS